MSRRTIRETIKRFAPAPLRTLIDGARGLTAQPPIDDAVLAEWRFVTDQTAKLRLTLLLPNVTQATFFGGYATGIDLFLEIGRQLATHVGLDLRILITNPTGQTEPGLAERRVGNAQDVLPEVSQLEGGSPEIPTRRHEIFAAFNWWTAHNIRPVMHARDAHYGIAPRPLVYFIQEYEPQIFPFCSAHLLARDAYDATERLWGVFNSGLLHDWFANCGHETERAFVFEPAMDARLQTYLPQSAQASRKKRILIYGRPSVARNCWPALVRGLERFVGDFPEYSDWDIVSAGGNHAPVKLGGGREIRPLGKLSLDEYAAVMLESSVGVSLMASPHPSYPPLEMAHFGLRTVTNSYWRKDLSALHDNILTTPSIDAAPLAATIAQACAQGPNAGASPMASYLRDAPFAVAGEIAEALKLELAG